VKTCAKICDVKYLGGRNLLIVFEDGLQREVALHTNWVGFTEPLNSDEFLSLVAIDSVSKTLSWPNGIELDSEVLRGYETPIGGEFFSVISETTVGLQQS